MPFYLGRKAIRKVPGAVIKAAPIPKPELIEGFGTREKVGEICSEAGFTTALLVTDETLFSLGHHEKITASLEAHGINNVRHWGRGVDAVRFHPEKRDPALRREWDRSGRKKIVGFVDHCAAFAEFIHYFAISRAISIMRVKEF